MGVQRIGLGLQKHQLERLRHICKEANTTQNRMFAACVSVMSVAEVKGILDRYAQLEAIETDLRMTVEKNLLDYVRGRSLDDMKRMLESVKRGSAVSAA